MSGRLAEVEARIGTVHKLASVISAMRGIAATRAQEARDHVDGIRVYAETIGAAIGEALTLLPNNSARESRDAKGADGHAIILFAAEQGFAGTYNEQVFEAAAPLLGPTSALMIAGDRGMLIAAERGYEVTWSAAMISHPAQAMGLATRISEALAARMAEGQIRRVTIVHAAPASESEARAVVTKTLVPFDFSRFPPSAHKVAPRITLSPETLVARLVEEYLFAELSEAVMLAFAAENAARMRAMIAAHDNVMESLDTLVAASQRLRQDEITDEIVELAAGRQTGR